MMKRFFGKGDSQTVTVGVFHLISTYNNSAMILLILLKFSNALLLHNVVSYVGINWHQVDIC